MTPAEFEINMKQASDRVFNKFFTDAGKELQTIVRQALADGVPRDDVSRVMDIACMSILSSFIINAVHPLGRDKFLADLAAGVKHLQNERSKVIEGNKVLVQ